MPVALDDPLIAAMDIRQTLPLHESSCRLRELCPQSPRDHGVAVLADSDELTGMRRSQAILDAMVGFGLPVRGGRPDTPTRRGR